jgi:hypothetical protein
MTSFGRGDVAGLRTAASKTDLSDILPEDMEAGLKEAAEVSMGTEISQEDLSNIQALCDQVGGCAVEGGCPHCRVCTCPFILVSLFHCWLVSILS